jgi:hypothetical protein
MDIKLSEISPIDASPKMAAPIAADKKFQDLITDAMSSIKPFVHYEKPIDWMEIGKWLLIVVVVGYVVIYHLYPWYQNRQTVVEVKEDEQQYSRYQQPQDYQYY